MLEEIKKQLLKDPEKLKIVLEEFGYCNVVIRSTYIQFGRDEISSKKSIVIKLENNDFLMVMDYARNIRKDIFGYIIEQRKVSFSDVLNVTKKVLGISDFYYHFENKGIFGGFYTNVKKKRNLHINVYDKSILDVYNKCANTKFIQDNISIETQKFFDIRYDIESQTIIIPIYTQLGDLMGVKARCNYDVEDGEMKYYYHVPCQCSQTLYGYAHNYEYLVGNTIYIGESEKFVMQCHTYGYRNCVGLGSGSLSTKQAQMILELHPKKVVFLHDNNYPIEFIMKNINILKHYSKFSEIQLGYWDWTKHSFPEKCSPSDLGKKQFEEIINNQIVYIEDDI